MPRAPELERADARDEDVEHERGRPDERGSQPAKAHDRDVTGRTGVANGRIEEGDEDYAGDEENDSCDIHRSAEEKRSTSNVQHPTFDEPRAPVRAEVRVRYRHTPAHATIEPLADRRVRVIFDEPQRAIAPGQATVFYRGDEVIGGGWIVKR